jgi:hypothetical protein
MYAMAAGLMYAGASFAHFAVGQACLGTAWNLCFVAATAELARCSTAGFARGRALGFRDGVTWDNITQPVNPMSYTLHSGPYTLIPTPYTPGLALRTLHPQNM